MTTLLRLAGVAARKDGIILLVGESGSGKDHVARYIHDHSPRAASPFYSLNCAAVPSELAESELFGHESGAFTGARGRKRGLVELAEGGTLLLNEVGELPLTLQAKLLTFLDTMTFTRIGGEKTISVNARIIAATNRNLEEELRAGRFRKDLFYRLNVLCLNIPPLRDRKADIPQLVREILHDIATDMQLSEIPEMYPGTEKLLFQYDWPGNVRELRNVLERALMLWERGPLKISPLEHDRGNEEWSYLVRFSENRSLTELTRDMRHSVVNEALKRARGNKSLAARTLGITRFSLLRVLKAASDSVE